MMILNFSCVSILWIVFNQAAGYDYQFIVGENDIFSNSQSYGCTTAGCSVTKTWLIERTCINPTLTVQILEHDYDSATENAYIYINNDYIGECTDVSQDCTFVMETCSIANNYDLSSYLNLPNIYSKDNISITLDCSDAVGATCSQSLRLDESRFVDI